MKLFPVNVVVAVCGLVFVTGASAAQQPRSCRTTNFTLEFEGTKQEPILNLTIGDKSERLSKDVSYTKRTLSEKERKSLNKRLKRSRADLEELAAIETDKVAELQAVMQGVKGEIRGIEAQLKSEWITEVAMKQDDTLIGIRFVYAKGGTIIYSAGFHSWLGEEECHQKVNGG